MNYRTTETSEQVTRVFRKLKNYFTIQGFCARAKGYFNSLQLINSGCAVAVALKFFVEFIHLFMELSIAANYINICKL